MKNIRLVTVIWFMSLGLAVCSQSEFTVYKLVEDQLELIEVSLKISSETDEPQMVASNEQMAEGMGLKSGDYTLEMISEFYPSFKTPFTVDEHSELASLDFTIIISDLNDVDGSIVGTQISSFNKRFGHLCGVFDYGSITKDLIRLIESEKGAQPDLLINTSVYYHASPSQIRDLIDQGMYVMDHDEITNVYFSEEGEYSF